MLADISMEVVLGMPFLSFSNADFQFGAWELTWRAYTVAKVLSTSRRVELIKKHEFAKAALGKNSETFVVHVTTLEAPDSDMSIHLSRDLLLAVLKKDKAPTEIHSEYADYADVFLFDLGMELPEKTGINEYTIELVECKQPPY